MPTLDMSPGAPTQFEAQTYQIDTVASGKNWLVNGGCQIFQRGAGPFAAPTNNDDVYCIDGSYLLSDGNNIAEPARVTESGCVSGLAIECGVATANKKFGLVWPVEWRDAAEIRRYGVASVQLKARQTSGTTIGALRVHLVGWSGPIDNITSDMVSAWNAAGSDFTPVANWTILGTATLTLSGTMQICVINGVAVGASHVNLAVFAVSDDTTTTVGDKALIGDVKLEAGPGTTPFVPESIAEATLRCKRLFHSHTGKADRVFGSGVVASATAASISVPFPTEMRVQPSISVPAVGDFKVFDGSTQTATSLTTTAVNPQSVRLSIGVAAGLTTGRGALLIDGGTGSANIFATAEL